MKRSITRDEFFEKQPPLGFIEYLRSPIHKNPPARFSRALPEVGEAYAGGIYFKNEFPDPEGLLDTVIEDFTAFASVTGILGERYPVYLKKAPTESRESYTVDIKEKLCTVSAADTEGIRRGIIYLEDCMTAAEGPLLPLGTVTRTPWLKSRITRGYFSPTNRPPRCGDELSDELDYYPDEYLNRLMHDGTNGLWIYTSFKQLLPSSIFPEYGEGYERRIKKLNGVIEKCKKYGIGVYVFAIEPCGLSEEMARKYPDIVGSPFWGANPYTLCPHTERVKAYCKEAGERLFTLCPELRGFISITAGERPTTCASAAPCTCVRCKDTPRGELLAESVGMLFEGMHAAKPDAECISWTYEHRNWRDADIADYVRCAPQNAVLMQNFADRGFKKQLGRVRLATDYWLSFAGPSDMFKLTADTARENGKTLFAKMQICSSHEVATLPYIPVPSLVFEKLRGAHSLGVLGIMESWYFGNYPCLMSKLVGELAFSNSFSDEDEALLRLASVMYGRSRAEAIARVWKQLAHGYKSYPLNIMFSYYSPAHDGVVWELSLLPKNLAPSRSWQLTDPPNGDRICDALLTGHTSDEAITLFERMRKSYRGALNELKKIPSDTALDELLTVSEALLILCESTLNILRFYRLRDSLGTGEGEPLELLEKTRLIVKDEIEQSRRMSELCKKDARLGYHSEAEGYKFFVEKLEWRIEKLLMLLNTEFPAVEERIRSGLAPLAYYLGEDDTEHRYKIKIGRAIDDAEWEFLDDGKTAFRMARDGDTLTMDLRSEDGAAIILHPEFRLFSVTAPIEVHFGKRHKIEPHYWSEHWPYFGRRKATELKKWSVSTVESGDGVKLARLSVRPSDFNMRGTSPFKLRIDSVSGAMWEREPNVTLTLGKPSLSPGCFGWIIFEE